MTPYAEIVVNTALAAPKAAESIFTYSIPPHLADALLVGQLVWVPFGKRRLQGILVGLSETSPVEQTKDLMGIVDPRPFLSPIQIDLARWIAHNYLCSLNAAIQLMLPIGIEQHGETLFSLVQDAPAQDLNPREQALVELLAKEGELRSKDIPARMRSAIETLMRRGVLSERSVITPPRARPKRIQSVRLVAPEHIAKLASPSATRQARVLEFLATGGSSAPDDVRQATGCSRKTLELLQANGWVDILPAQETLALTNKYHDELPALPETQSRVLVYLREQGKPVHVGELQSKLGAPRRTLSALEKNGYVARAETPERVLLKRSPALGAAAIGIHSVYRNIVDFLQKEVGPVWISAVYAATGCTRGDLQRLETAGVVAFEEHEVWRDPLARRAFDLVEPPQLTAEQESAWQTLRASLRLQSSPTVGHKDGRQAPTNFLLHGVTGSGKTEIYMCALDEMVGQGKQGIVLVPEIALTPQTIRRFGARFGNRLGVLHSRLSLGERYDTWRRCRDGRLDIVIGSRSALFAPLPRLGLIIVDEEQEPAYKQDSVPHYHARAVALELGRRMGATVVLGSATPDLETFYRALRGEFVLLRLPQRIMGHRQFIEAKAAELKVNKTELPVHAVDENLANARYMELPPVEVIDLRAELRAGNRSIFSRILQRELKRTFSAHEQAILFLNRRGAATFILCRDCGNAFKCRRCDNPMTYHLTETSDELVCHHCNHRSKMPARCPKCGSPRIRYFGAGTQTIEEEIHKLFPDVRTLRWDLDVTRGKDAHEAILEQFISHRADVLIGTQMIAKGLDLPLVTLVGVVSADTSLNLPDFRAAERTFQLLTQVAGRAGRSILGGRVILQTYNPDHYAIQAASCHDYASFYEREISFRHEQGYPPFSRLIRLVFLNRSERKCQEQAAQLHLELTKRIGQMGLPETTLIGPAPAFFHRVRGEYRFQIIIRSPEPHALLEGVTLPLGWRVDVDPVSVL